MELAFRAMGTDWWLRSEGGDGALLQRAQQLVAGMEQTLSRFRADSALSRLNQERAIEDPCVAEVVKAAEQARLLTGGAFDARTGAALVAAGYDRDFEQIGNVQTLASDGRRPCVAVEGARVTLRGEGTLDLGGIAKGWAVDRVAELLAEAGPCLVDGGGDIAVRGGPHQGTEWLIGVGEGLAVGLIDAAVATSSTLRRRWCASDGREAHHIIDPRCSDPATGLLTAVVVAPTAALADALATALVADAVATLPALPEAGAEAMVLQLDGQWQTTPGMRRYLR